MTSINESIVEAAALTGFGELGYTTGLGPHMAPGEPAAERDLFGDVVLVGCLREVSSVGDTENLVQRAG